ncbi:MAG TPA: hypothetical protein VJZ76_08150 [Thermoanaerobaculia bacterium]|nr:hypothetical protein [Thermoanaerobaculia bacterium]
MSNAPPKALGFVNEFVPMFLGEEWNDKHLEIVKPYPLYTFALNDVIDGRPLAAALLSAWEFLIVDGESVVAMAEICARDADGKEDLSYATLHPRSYATAIAETIAAAEVLPEVADTPFELRLLRAPSLSLLAIWLHRADDDLLFPVRPLRDNVALMRTVWNDRDAINGEEALTQVLRPVAELRLNAQDFGG